MTFIRWCGSGNISLVSYGEIILGPYGEIYLRFWQDVEYSSLIVKVTIRKEDVIIYKEHGHEIYGQSLMDSGLTFVALRYGDGPFLRISVKEMTEHAIVCSRAIQSDSATEVIYQQYLKDCVVAEVTERIVVGNGDTILLIEAE